MVRKLNTKYLLISSTILLAILLSIKDKVKAMLPTSQNEFIKFIYPYAKTIGQAIGVPAIFIVAQICLETGFGKSSLFSKYFNVGGIKATKGQPFVTLMTTEYENGVKVKKPQNFAVYNDLNTGLVSYAKILQNKYFKKYLHQTEDPNKYVDLLQSGSPKYATDINYSSKIKKLITLVSQVI